VCVCVAGKLPTILNSEWVCLVSAQETPAHPKGVSFAATTATTITLLSVCLSFSLCQHLRTPPSPLSFAPRFAPAQSVCCVSIARVPKCVCGRHCPAPLRHAQPPANQSVCAPVCKPRNGPYDFFVYPTLLSILSSRRRSSISQSHHSNQRARTKGPKRRRHLQFCTYARVFSCVDACISLSRSCVR